MKRNFNQSIILILFFLGSGNVLAEMEITFTTSNYGGYSNNNFMFKKIVVY